MGESSNCPATREGSSADGITRRPSRDDKNESAIQNVCLVTRHQCNLFLQVLIPYQHVSVADVTTTIIHFLGWGHCHAHCRLNLTPSMHKRADPSYVGTIPQRNSVGQFLGVRMSIWLRKAWKFSPVAYDDLSSDLGVMVAVVEVKKGGASPP